MLNCVLHEDTNHQLDSDEAEENKEECNDPDEEPWPSCWDRKIWECKKKEYPWLVCNKKKLGCSVCKEVSSLGCFSQKSVHLSVEWKLVAISPSGNTKENNSCL